jgi:hypothetical protein
MSKTTEPKAIDASQSVNVAEKQVREACANGKRPFPSPPELKDIPARAPLPNAKSRPAPKA